TQQQVMAAFLEARGGRSLEPGSSAWNGALQHANGHAASEPINTRPGKSHRDTSSAESARSSNAPPSARNGTPRHEGAGPEHETGRSARPEQGPPHELSAVSIEQALLEQVSRRTGYPMEMLGLDLDVEGDLGIDSIKRVEILGDLQTRGLV